MRFFFTATVVLILLVAGLFLYSTLKVEDLTEASRDLNQEIDRALHSRGITDADIATRYQTHLRRRGLEWIKYTKDITLGKSRYLDLFEDIRRAAAEFHFKEKERTSRGAHITVTEGPALLSDLRFSFIPDKGLLAIVIDDLGYSPDVEPFLELDIPLTYAIIPGLNYSRSLTEKLKEKDLPYILHMPMEPEDSSLISDEPMLLVTMDGRQIEKTLNEALETVPGAAGLNNHMGSRFSANSKSVEKLLQVIKDKELFLIDSKTSGDSLLFPFAREAGVPAAQNNFFIDNNKDYDYIYGRVEKLTQLAASRRLTLAIGHVQNENTARVLKEFIPKMKEAGITFVKAEEILR